MRAESLRIACQSARQPAHMLGIGPASAALLGLNEFYYILFFNYNVYLTT